MFDNRKVKRIRHLPEGNNIILIWVMLLAMAGRCNAGGKIFLTENIPYDADSLSDELGFDRATIVMAISALSSFGMIIADEKQLIITNWNEYQNVEGLDKVREQTRKRVANYRQKQLESNVTRNATVTQGNATEEEIEEDKDIKNKNKDISHKYGFYNNVLLTDSDIEKLKTEFPVDWESRIERLSDYIAQSGRAYKNHLATIRNWARRDAEKPVKPNIVRASCNPPKVDMDKLNTLIDEV